MEVSMSIQKSEKELEEEKLINDVYEKLLYLTYPESYYNKDTPGHDILNDLHTSLFDSENRALYDETSPFSYHFNFKQPLTTDKKIDYIRALQTKLQTLLEDSPSLKETSRKKLACDIVSVLTLLPAALRAGYSYYHYGNANFFKSEAQRMVESAKDKLEKENMKPLLDNSPSPRK
jgi:hypothetical protein